MTQAPRASSSSGTRGSADGGRYALPELIEPLREHFASQDAERRAAVDAWEGWGLAWCGPRGQPIDPHDDWEEWKALLAEAGIAKDARLHDARHTAGTLAEGSSTSTST